MTFRLNCWEYNNCGREVGGILAETEGACPVALAMSYDGTNGGRAAGRACWMIPLSCCKRSSTASCADKACHQCSFFKRVIFEEENPCTTKRIETPAPAPQVASETA